MILQVADCRLAIDGLAIERLKIDGLSIEEGRPITNRQFVDRQSAIDNPPIGNLQPAIANVLL